MSISLPMIKDFTAPPPGTNHAIWQRNGAMLSPCSSHDALRSGNDATIGG